jgi:hypothetical protein
MRKETVSRMRGRYAQTVLTFRITYVLAKISKLSFTILYALKFLRASISPGVPLPLCSAVQEFVSRVTLWHQRTLHTFVWVWTFPCKEVHRVNLARAVSSAQKDGVSHTKERVCVGYLAHNSIAITYTGYVFSYRILVGIMSYTHTYATAGLISDLGLESNSLQSRPCFESSDFYSGIRLSYSILTNNTIPISILSTSR